VITPWTDHPELMPRNRIVTRHFLNLLVVVGGGFTLTIVAMFLARKNIRLGRGDRKGAFRLAAWYFVLSWAARLLLAHHVGNFDAEANIIFEQAAVPLLYAALIWILYIALEPSVRRRWPEYLISWTRLLAGDLRNPMVGRDVLAGALGGALLALVAHVVNGLPAWFHLAGQTPINVNTPAVGPTQKFIGYVLSNFTGPITAGLTMLFLFFILRVAIRRYWLAVVLFSALNLVLYAGNENVIAEGTGAVVSVVLVAVVLLRFGLLGLIAAYTVQNFLEGFPIALDPSRWYFARGFVPVLIVLALAIYGFRISLGARPVFGFLTAEE
ncbi:MAG TPA: hypothetical protein VM912_18320, partial [Terriglobales bacterium]|nr:hypothetical protein [Terriglobales bacterium]